MPRDRKANRPNESTPATTRARARATLGKDKESKVRTTLGKDKENLMVNTKTQVKNNTSRKTKGLQEVAQNENVPPPNASGSSKAPEKTKITEPKPKSLPRTNDLLTLPDDDRTAKGSGSTGPSTLQKNIQIFTKKKTPSHYRCPFCKKTASAGYVFLCNTICCKACSKEGDLIVCPNCDALDGVCGEMPLLALSRHLAELKRSKSPKPVRVRKLMDDWIPFDTVEKLREFDDSLINEKGMMETKKLIESVITEVNGNVYDTLKNVLAQFVSPKLWGEYTYRNPSIGIKKKSIFAKRTICKIIRDVMAEHFEEANDETLYGKKAAAAWKTIKDRGGNRNARRVKTQTISSDEDSD